MCYVYCICVCTYIHIYIYIYTHPLADRKVGGFVVIFGRWAAGMPADAARRRTECSEGLSDDRIRMYVCTYVRTYVCMCIHIYIYIYIRCTHNLYVLCILHMCVYIYVYIYIYIYTYIYTHPLADRKVGGFVVNLIWLGYDFGVIQLWKSSGGSERASELTSWIEVGSLIICSASGCECALFVVVRSVDLIMMSAGHGKRHTRVLTSRGVLTCIYIYIYTYVYGLQREREREREREKERENPVPLFRCPALCRSFALCRGILRPGLTDGATTHIRVYIYIHIYIHTYICMYIYIYIHMCVCIYIYIYIHICILYILTSYLTLYYTILYHII